MEVIIHNYNNRHIAEIKSNTIILNELQDGLDLIGLSTENDVIDFIISKNNISEDFFDLKTGLAGDILQKFSTYGLIMAIVGDFSGYQSKSLRDFIYESNKVGRINFVPSLDEALTALSD